MATVAELLDQGVKSYTRGDPAEAERLWLQALELDPQNERVRAYLRQVRGERPGQPVAAPPPTAPAPAVPARPEPPFAPSPWDSGPAASPTVLVEEGSGLDLGAVAEKSEIRPLVPEQRAQSRPTAAGDIATWMEGARELFALGDFSGSLEMIERILRVDPTHAEARAYLRQNESTLVAMYESKLGALGTRPRLAIHPEEVLWLNLDHRAGFLLAQIDGVVSYEDLFALSGLPRLDTARILASLVSEGVIR
jgi:tetratricopeptide (TPR) repeat protein